MTDIWIAKHDATGAVVRQKRLGGSTVEQSGTILPLADGSVIVLGDTDSPEEEAGDEHGNGVASVTIQQ